MRTKMLSHADDEKPRMATNENLRRRKPYKRARNQTPKIRGPIKTQNQKRNPNQKCVKHLQGD